jgi:formamidopyrimidine-DNA glycosylase
MPEIAEGETYYLVEGTLLTGSVARVVHHIRKSLVGKTIKAVNALDDSNVFGKAGTSGAEFQKAMVGKKIVGAGQQGKYFWFENLDRAF